jgi:hypothetical protein
LKVVEVEGAAQGELEAVVERQAKTKV